MPIKLSEIVAQERWLTVDVGGVEIQVAYRPNNISLRRSNELNQLLNSFETNPDIDVGRETARMFCDLVGNWDIVDDKGKPLPITVDSLLDIPARLIMTILAAVNADVEELESEKKASSETFADGSTQKGSLAPARNGTP
jgi:hypothetical protein